MKYEIGLQYIWDKYLKANILIAHTTIYTALYLQLRIQLKWELSIQHKDFICDFSYRQLFFKRIILVSCANTTFSH